MVGPVLFMNLGDLSFNDVWGPHVYKGLGVLNVFNGGAHNLLGVGVCGSHMCGK